MKTVQAIIDKWGGIEKLKEDGYYIKLKQEGYDNLVIEFVGNYKDTGHPLISVAHYYEQNGDMMRDPEIVFIANPAGWQPMTYQQDNLGIYQEIVFDNEEGKTMVNIRQLNSCKSFSRTWDRNIKDQGWLEIEVNSAIEKETVTA